MPDAALKILNLWYDIHSDAPQLSDIKMPLHKKVKFKKERLICDAFRKEQNSN